MKLTAIIFSKNAALTRTLTNLSSKGSSIEILGIVSSSKECLDAINQDLPDIVFVDVDFFAGQSFELCNNIYLPLVVPIVNTNNQHAEAFMQHLSVCVNDATYLELTCPVTPVKFYQLIDKILNLPFQSTSSFLINEQKAAEYKNDVFVRNEQGYTRVLLDDIFFFENVGEYVSIKTSKRNFIILATMKSLERRLDPHIFIKIHRSYIVNMKHINYINDTHLTVMSKTIPISRAHRQYLLNAINIL
jgi:two-component system, LytTR family, response regulator LytT